MRYIFQDIKKDLERKMVFIGGPSQVGKTTLSKTLLYIKFPNRSYFNWDYDNDKRDLLAQKWRRDSDLIIFDELHKYPNWKNWIKGIYDVSENRHRFLVTGSARLDVYKRSGDSLIVLSNLAGNIQVSLKTASSWLDILEKMYLVFVVRPYTKNLPRAVRKPPKVFFFDSGDVIGDKGAVFENLVASHLLKRIHYLEDREGYRYELRYIRNKEGREIGFVILRDGIIEELIEAKYSDDSVSKHLKYYAERLNPEKATQVVATLKKPYSSGKIDIVGPFEYFKAGI